MIKPTYYYLVPKQTDNYGLTHGYNNFFSRVFDKEEFEHFQMSKEIKYDNYRDGPPRLYEIPRFNPAIYPLLIVSENIKEFFSHLNLPKHQYTSKVLQHYKLTSDTNYFVLQLKENSLLENLDWENTKFFYTLGSNKKSLEEKVMIESNINNKDELIKERERLKDVLNTRVINIHPQTFPQTKQFDIITYHYPYIFSSKVIMVPDYIKTSFEKYFPNEVDFIKVEALNIYVEENEYQERKQTIENLNFTPKKLSYKIDAELQFYFSKMERLQKQEKILLQNQEEIDEFTEKENELKKKFPSQFKNLYRKNSSLNYFEWLPIKDFHLEYEYSSSFPQTFGSVIFARDGSGESLGLLLKKDSDVELGEDWFYFSHEDGNVIKISDIREYTDP